MYLPDNAQPSQLLYSQRLRKELHHLLWIKPFDNRGTWDPGWSCRDHAFIAAVVAQLLGHALEVVHGEAMFIRGITEEAAGIGIHQRWHTWLAIQHDGLMDISVRLATADPEWRDLEYVACTACSPRGDLQLAHTTENFETASIAARYLPGEHAIYREERRSVVDRQMASNAFDAINSPLTVMLSKKYPCSIYAKLAMHSFELLNGRAESLTGLQTDYAWKKVARLPDNAVDWLEANGGLR